MTPDLYSLSLYQCVQLRVSTCQFIGTYSKIVSLIKSFSAPKNLSLSKFIITFSVMSVQSQYLSKFVSEKGESQYFFGLVVYASNHVKLPVP